MGSDRARPPRRLSAKPRTTPAKVCSSNTSSAPARSTATPDGHAGDPLRHAGAPRPVSQGVDSMTSVTPSPLASPMYMTTWWPPYTSRSPGASARSPRPPAADSPIRSPGCHHVDAGPLRHPPEECGPAVAHSVDALVVAALISARTPIRGTAVTVLARCVAEPGLAAGAHIDRASPSGASRSAAAVHDWPGGQPRQLHVPRRR